MRRLRFRGRRRNRIANAIEQVALRILTVLWIARVLLRHARLAGR
ncbi:MAG TPA: hypothetical protein VK874_05970 [Gaiellaceae bacterium]|nr:hypothetical protein [Gaiellaceae bacterium]